LPFKMRSRKASHGFKGDADREREKGDCQGAHGGRQGYYLRGRRLFYQFRRRGYDFARQMFARAIEIDHFYARLRWRGRFLLVPLYVLGQQRGKFACGRGPKSKGIAARPCAGRGPCAQGTSHLTQKAVRRVLPASLYNRAVSNIITGGES
jgi:hypothetical protein